MLSTTTSISSCKKSCGLASRIAEEIPQTPRHLLQQHNQHHVGNNHGQQRHHHLNHLHQRSLWSHLFYKRRRMSLQCVIYNFGYLLLLLCSITMLLPQVKGKLLAPLLCDRIVFYGFVFFLLCQVSFLFRGIVWREQVN